jgi:hypothetical protein
MQSQYYELVRLEHRLRLARARAHPTAAPRQRRDVGVRLPRIPRRRQRPLMQTHEYLELEFAVDDRR